MKNTIKIFIITLILSFTTLAQEFQLIELESSSIKVPKEWSIYSPEGENKVYNILVVNKKGLSTGENINFTSTDIGVVINDMIITLSLNSTLAMLKDTYDKVTLIDKGNNYILIDVEVSGSKMRQKLVMNYKESTVYYLAFTASQDTYDTYKDMYEKIENSFELD